MDTANRTSPDLFYRLHKAMIIFTLVIRPSYFMTIYDVRSGPMSTMQMADFRRKISFYKIKGHGPNLSFHLTFP